MAVASNVEASSYNCPMYYLRFSIENRADFRYQLVSKPLYLRDRIYSQSTTIRTSLRRSQRRRKDTESVVAITFARTRTFRAWKYPYGMRNQRYAVVPPCGIIMGLRGSARGSSIDGCTRVTRKWTERSIRGPLKKHIKRVEGHGGA